MCLRRFTLLNPSSMQYRLKLLHRFFEFPEFTEIEFRTRYGTCRCSGPVTAFRFLQNFSGLGEAAKVVKVESENREKKVCSV